MSQGTMLVACFSHSDGKQKELVWNLGMWTMIVMVTKYFKDEATLWRDLEKSNEVSNCTGRIFAEIYSSD